MVSLPPHKTKIVATIGPAPSSPPVLEQMIRAGMNIARLNFSHGDFDTHGNVIAAIRAAAKTVSKPVKEWVRRHNLLGDFAILTQQPTANDSESNHRMEIINL
jgi:Pyruvate kinase, barrel domain